MLLYGFFSNVTSLGFSYARENNKASNSGVATALINTVTFILISLTQILPQSFYMNLGSIGKTSYRYDTAFIMFPLMLIIALLCTFFMKETHCNLQVND